MDIKYKSRDISISIDKKACVNDVAICGRSMKCTGKPISKLRLNGVFYEAVYAEAVNGLLRLTFENTVGRAEIKVDEKDECLIFTVIDAPECDMIVFADINAPGTLLAAMALNPFTNGADIISADGSARATAYKETGIKGASCAVLGTDEPERMRELMKSVTEKYTVGIPYSKLGGAFSLDKENSILDGSYLMNLSGIRSEEVDGWISMAKAFGATQIDFHGGDGTCRFGDCRFNQNVYPDGADSMKRIIDRLHAAGIKAGFHTYAQFISPYAEYVTPIPDPELAGKNYTMAKDMDDTGLSCSVLENLDGVTSVTGFFVMNSAHIVIDNEIMKFSKAENGVFTLTARGEFGTKPAAHKAGAKVKHLMSMFGLFVPDGNSELYLKVARKTAETFNYCGFDMIYLDAIDGTVSSSYAYEDTEKAVELSWYYSNRFVAELMRSLEKTPVLEMSAMWHHMWYYRSRMGAWDHSNRAHKLLLAEHDRSNIRNRNNTFMRQNFGWWCCGKAKKDDPCQYCRMYIDDYEYYASRSLCHGWSLAFITGLEEYRGNDELKRAAALIGRYEKMRSDGVNADDLGELFLRGDGNLVHVEYFNADSPTVSEPLRFETKNEKTPLLVRAVNTAFISDTDPVSLISPSDSNKLAAYVSLNAQGKAENGCIDGKQCIWLNYQQNDSPAYARFEKRFTPKLNAAGHIGMGAWVYGDGSGVLLDIQLISPKARASGTSDRVIKLDFTGWRYVKLLNCGAEMLSGAELPFSHGGHYNNAKPLPQFAVGDDVPLNQYEWHPSRKDVSIYNVLREPVFWDDIESVSLILCGLDGKAECRVGIGDISLYPIISEAVTDPELTINGETVKIEGKLEPFSYAEYRDGKTFAFDADGRELDNVRMVGAEKVRLSAQNTAYAVRDGIAVCIGAEITD